MKKIGLVFAGGGAKGAYEIGVWEALDRFICGESNLSDAICGVSGTSVGALNAALFAQHDLEEAKAAWSELTTSQIVKLSGVEKAKQLWDFLLCPEKRREWFASQMSAPHKTKTGTAAARIAIAGSVLSSPLMVRPAVSAAALAPYVAKALLPFLSANIGILIPYWIAQLKNGVLTASGIQNMIDAHLHYEQIRNSAIRCYATSLRLKKHSIQRFLLNQCDNDDDINHILLASAAIPLIFQMGKIDGEYYIDGGIPKFGDNVPLAPLCEGEETCDALIVVTLDDSKRDYSALYQNVETISICPSKKLGSAMNVLDFKPEHIKTRMKYGLEDGMAILAENRTKIERWLQD
ncbi:MAG: patatin-like phospholipase family protein [Pseudoflavonifractor sp.]